MLHALPRKPCKYKSRWQNAKVDFLVARIVPEATSDRSDARSDNASPSPTTKQGADIAFPGSARKYFLLVQERRSPCKASQKSHIWIHLFNILDKGMGR
jgi:hypothetical protein